MYTRSFAIGFAASALALAVLLVATDVAACRTTTCSATPGSLGCSVDAVTGCMIGGQPLFWEQPCVSFSVDSRAVPSLKLEFRSVEQLVSASFSLWPNAQCTGGFPSIAVSSLGSLLCHVPEFNHTGPNANGVIFYETDWPHDPTQIGVTTVSFDTDTGKILDADMEVNLTTFVDTPTRLRYVVSHEAGHFLGLDHSADPTALMYRSYSPISSSGNPLLAADDIAGICAAYPPSRPVGVCDFEPERGYASDCGGDVVTGCQVEPWRANSSVPMPLLAASAIAASVVLRRRCVTVRRSPPKANAARSARVS